MAIPMPFRGPTTHVTVLAAASLVVAVLTGLVQQNGFAEITDDLWFAPALVGLLGVLPVGMAGVPGSSIGTIETESLIGPLFLPALRSPPTDSSRGRPVVVSSGYRESCSR